MAVNPAAASAGPQVTGAIRQAAQSTGISFEYLLTTAKIESNLNPSAQASTSSAKGLYQFIDQTWLGTMKQAGAALGLGQYADAITRSPDGHYDVSDPAMRAAILRLRSDPQASAMLAGALTRNNAALVGWQYRPSAEQWRALYRAFSGCRRCVQADQCGVNAGRQASAAAMFPNAAAANHNIFYDGSGRARSVGEVYRKLTDFSIPPATLPSPQGGFVGRDRPAAACCAAFAATRDRGFGAAYKSAAGHTHARRRHTDAPPMPPRAHPARPDTRRHDAGLCAAPANSFRHPPATRAIVPIHVHGSRQAAAGANREPALGADPRPGRRQPHQTAQVFDLFTDPRPNDPQAVGRQSLILA